MSQIQPTLRPRLDLELLAEKSGTTERATKQNGSQGLLGDLRKMKPVIYRDRIIEVRREEMPVDILIDGVLRYTCVPLSYASAVFDAGDDR